MNKISFLLFTVILLVLVFMPLFTAIETGFASTDGYYGSIY